MEGQGVLLDDGKVDQRVGKKLVGEDCRADGDDEQSKLGHHPENNYKSGFEIEDQSSVFFTFRFPEIQLV